jgi:hypothetical protein
MRDAAMTPKPQAARTRAPRVDAAPVPPAIAAILQPAGPGRALDDPLRRDAETAFGRSFALVRLHCDAAAAGAVDGVGARAATHGWNMLLGSGAPRVGTPQYRNLLWHELTHVAQQAGRAVRPGTALLSDPRGTHETQADRVAAGRLPGSAVTGGADTALIHRQGKHSTPSNDVTSIEQAMDAAGPAAAGRTGLDLLRHYPVEDTVDLAVQLDRAHRLETIAGAVLTNDTSPLVGVLFAVLYLSANTRATPSWGIVAATVLGRLPAAQRMPLLESVLRASGRADEISMLREGTEAFDESESTLAATPEREVDAATAAIPPTMAGIVPGRWNPGRQPIPFYLGNAGHVGIAAAYVAAHVGDAVFTNVVSVATILAAARRAGLAIGRSRASAGQLAMEPDIANLTRAHLYEIKPSTLQSLGRAEAALYVAAFAAAGLTIGLGPTTEPGTSGVIPGPGGWYEFRSPEPGVITYNHRQPPRVRVRVPVLAPEPAPAPARSSKSIRQRVSEITGLTGTALTIYLIISEGSRIVFPPRNAIPAP